MDINLNVNINAPELCASMNNLAAALLVQKPTTVATDIPVDKSNFTFKLADTTAAESTANDSPAQDTGAVDNKPAAEEVQKVEREVIRKVLKAKVDAGKKAQVRAFLDTYGIGISLPNIAEEIINTEMLAKAEAL